MKAQPKVETTTVYTSDVYPSVHSDLPHHAAIIAWADAHPVAWSVVTQTRSAPFGRGSSTYIGWAQKGMGSGAILARIEHLRRELDTSDSPLVETLGVRSRTVPGHGSFWAWRAAFTLEHYKAKGFRGGFFQEHDGTYDRHSCQLDYTPETLRDVALRFWRWCSTGPCRYDGKSLKIDGVTRFMVVVCTACGGDGRAQDVMDKACAHCTGDRVTLQEVAGSATVPARKGRKRAADPDDEDEEEDGGVA